LAGVDVGQRLGGGADRLPALVILADNGFDGVSCFADTLLAGA
jgi:hypothetical protein